MGNRDIRKITDPDTFIPLAQAYSRLKNTLRFLLTLDDRLLGAIAKNLNNADDVAVFERAIHYLNKGCDVASTDSSASPAYVWLDLLIAPAYGACGARGRDIVNAIVTDMGDEVMSPFFRAVDQVAALGLELSDEAWLGAARFTQLVKHHNEVKVDHVIDRFAGSSQELEEILVMINRLGVRGDAIQGLDGIMKRLGSAGKAPSGTDNAAKAIRFTWRHFAGKDELDTITGFEISRAIGDGNDTVRLRRYDSQVGEIDYEFKNWTRGKIQWHRIGKDVSPEELDDLLAEGRRFAGEEIEWLNDVVNHASTDFADLKWVINSKVAENPKEVAKLKRNMLEAFDHPWVKARLKKPPAELSDEGILALEDKFDTEIFDRVVEFAEDQVVKDL